MALLLLLLLLLLTIELMLSMMMMAGALPVYCIACGLVPNIKPHFRGQVVHFKELDVNNIQIILLLLLLLLLLPPPIVMTWLTCRGEWSMQARADGRSSLWPRPG